MAGIMDGDGNFDVRTINGVRKLKSIRVKLGVRDAKILYRLKEIMQTGNIGLEGEGKYGIFRISHSVGMLAMIKQINGHIRIKVPGMIEACQSLGVEYKPAPSKIPKNSAYLAGLLDTDGSVVLNGPGNRIELAFEFQQNEQTLALDFSEVIEGASPAVRTLNKTNQSAGKTFLSVRYVYDNVSHMLPIYEYFIKHKCYSDFKYYRVMKIKEFLAIRLYKAYKEDTLEYRKYTEFVLDFFTHLNESRPLPKYIQDRIATQTDNDIVHKDDKKGS